MLIRLLDALTAVIVCEQDPDRRGVLQHHADLVWADALREVGNASDRDDVRRHYQRFERAVAGGVLGALRAIGTDPVVSDAKA